MYQKYFKRLFDVIGALIGLPFLLILIIIFGSLIWLEDKGPIFYIAPRLGKDGKTFKMYKFRSMKVNAPDIRLVDGSTYNDENDFRVTKVGNFIRKYSIDEVPQLLNVLIGEMSLIGPRPDPEDWIGRYPENVKIFLSAKPGVTGYNQAYFRNSVDSIVKMRNDVFYALNCSFSMDIKILLKTILIVLKKENIYKLK